MKHFGKRWTFFYTVILFLFFIYSVLDTFVISSVYTVVEQKPEEIVDPTASAKQAQSAQSQKGRTKGKRDKGMAKVHAEETDQGARQDTEQNTNQNTEQNADRDTKQKTDPNAERNKNQNAEQNTERNTKQKDTQAQDGKSAGAESAITLTEYREYDTTIYAAQIDTSSVVALRAAFARNAYGRNVTEKTSETAETVGAVLAINGDYYGARETGYVIRNGVLYREDGKVGQEDLVLYQDGSMGIIREEEVTAEELVAQGAWQVWSFGPALLVDGEINVSATDEVAKAMQNNPRTAIGILGNGDYLMVVSDGRTDESQGLSLYELAEFMKSLGAVTAYNLDGGGSSTMVYQGELVNNPTTTGRIKERAVSDIIYIAY